MRARWWARVQVHHKNTRRYLWGRITRNTRSKGLTVVFLEEHSLEARWKDISGQEFRIYGQPVSPMISDAPAASYQTPMRHLASGAFDHRTDTVYCPKMDFEACGRELHFALFGHSHTEQY